MRVLVCGSRDWGDQQTIFKRLCRLPRDTVIIHGACSRKIDGVEQSTDMIADEVAYWLLEFKVEQFPANWEFYGRTAGFVRNLEMLDTNPDLVIAFQRNCSRGTQHTITHARKRGIPVEVITEEKIAIKSPSRSPGFLSPSEITHEGEPVAGRFDVGQDRAIT